jgi:hypothetical protein
MINRNGQQPDPSLLMEEEGDYDDQPSSWRPVETANTVLDDPGYAPRVVRPLTHDERARNVMIWLADNTE